MLKMPHAKWELLNVYQRHQTTLKTTSMNAFEVIETHRIVHHKKITKPCTIHVITYIIIVINTRTRKNSMILTSVVQLART